MKRKAMPILILCLFLLGACALFQKNLTSQERYYQALSFFNDNLEQYLASYSAATPETQAKWKTNINPVIKKASQALDAWGAVLGASTTIEKEQAWLSINKQFLAALVEIGVLKIEGGK